MLLRHTSPYSSRLHPVCAGAASSKADSAAPSAPSGAASLEGSLREPEQTEQSRQQQDVPELKVDHASHPYTFQFGDCILSTAAHEIWNTRFGLLDTLQCLCDIVGPL